MSALVCTVVNARMYISTHLCVGVGVCKCVCVFTHACVRACVYDSSKQYFLIIIIVNSVMAIQVNIQVV